MVTGARLALLLAVPVLASAAAHAGILDNFFRHDDFLHLYGIENERLEVFVLKRPDTRIAGLMLAPARKPGR